MYSTVGNASGTMFDYLKTVSLHLSSYRVIVIIWALGLSLAIPPLVGWSHYSPEPNGLRLVISILSLSKSIVESFVTLKYDDFSSF